MRDKDLHALGYREVQHAGFSWLANKEGARFFRGVDDWSEGLAMRRGWSFWDKGSHALYLAQDCEGVRFLVKIYRGKKRSAGLFAREANKAKKEFHNTLFAHKKGFKTVLPLALGETNRDRSWGVIVYPFLDNVIPLDRAYPYTEPGALAVPERQYVEKSVGRLLRKCIDSGIFPVNMCPGHFLAKRDVGEGLVVYWVDFEKVKFKSVFKERYAIKNLGKLLARVEWFRVSGGRINRSSVMRIGYACFCKEGSGKLDKRLCHAVIRAAKKYWEFRRIDARGLYPLSSIQPINQVAP